MNDVGRPHAISLARAMVLPWVMPVHIPLAQLHRSRATGTPAGVTRFAKRSVKRLGKRAVSQMSGPATRDGPSSMPGETPANAKTPEAGSVVVLGGAVNAVHAAQDGARYEL